MKTKRKSPYYEPLTRTSFFLILFSLFLASMPFVIIWIELEVVRIPISAFKSFRFDTYLRIFNIGDYLLVVLILISTMFYGFIIWRRPTFILGLLVQAVLILGMFPYLSIMGTRVIVMDTLFYDNAVEYELVQIINTGNYSLRVYQCEADQCNRFGGGIVPNGSSSSYISDADLSYTEDSQNLIIRTNYNEYVQYETLLSLEGEIISSERVEQN